MKVLALGLVVTGVALSTLTFGPTQAHAVSGCGPDLTLTGRHTDAPGSHSDTYRDDVTNYAEFKISWRLGDDYCEEKAFSAWQKQVNDEKRAKEAALRAEEAERRAQERHNADLLKKEADRVKALADAKRAEELANKELELVKKAISDTEKQNAEAERVRLQNLDRQLRLCQQYGADNPLLKGQCG